MVRVAVVGGSGVADVEYLAGLRVSQDAAQGFAEPGGRVLFGLGQQVVFHLGEFGEDLGAVAVDAAVGEREEGFREPGGH